MPTRYASMVVNADHVLADGEFCDWLSPLPAVGGWRAPSDVIVTGFCGRHNGFCNALELVARGRVVARMEVAEWAAMTEFYPLDLALRSAEVLRAFATSPAVGLIAGLVLRYQAAW
jgi:hypothetical protein